MMQENPQTISNIWIQQSIVVELAKALYLAST